MLTKAKAAKLAEYRRMRKAKEKMTKMDLLRYKILVCDEQLAKLEAAKKRDWKKQALSLLAEYDIKDPEQLRSILQSGKEALSKASANGAETSAPADDESMKLKDRASKIKRKSKKTK